MNRYLRIALMLLVPPILWLTLALSYELIQEDVHKQLKPLMGYMDDKGKLVIPMKFQQATAFKDGLAAVRVADPKVEHPWGYISKDGNWAIKPRFDDAYTFRDGLAIVFLGEHYGFIDKKGNMAIRAKFSNASPFSENLAAVGVERGDDVKWGYIDRVGEFVIEPTYEDAESFVDGLAAAKSEGKWGFINKKGEFVIEPRFDDVNDFSEGLAWVDEHGYIDKTGTVVIPDRFEEAYNFLEGFAVVEIEHGKFRYIDKQGNYVFDTYEWAQSFSEGLALVQIKNKCGFMDKTGRLVIPAQYDSAESFEGGFAEVEKDGKEFFINHRGERLAGTHEFTHNFSEGLVSVGEIPPGLQDQRRWDQISDRAPWAAELIANAVFILTGSLLARRRALGAAIYTAAAVLIWMMMSGIVSIIDESSYILLWSNAQLILMPTILFGLVLALLSRTYGKKRAQMHG